MLSARHRNRDTTEGGSAHLAPSGAFGILIDHSGVPATRRRNANCVPSGDQLIAVGGVSRSETIQSLFSNRSLNRSAVSSV